MNKNILKNKFEMLEAEMKLLKSAFFSKPIDFDADEKVWSKIGSIVKKTRAKIYRKSYA